jgi:hypothetical protein
MSKDQELSTLPCLHPEVIQNYIPTLIFCEEKENKHIDTQSHAIFVEN